MSDNVKESVGKIISDKACSIQLYLLLKKNGQYELKLADVEDVATSELQQLFVSNLDSTIVNKYTVNHEYLKQKKTLISQCSFLFFILHISGMESDHLYIIL